MKSTSLRRAIDRARGTHPHHHLTQARLNRSADSSALFTDPDAASHLHRGGILPR